MEQPDNIDKEVELDSEVTHNFEDHHSDKDMLIHVGIRFFLLFIIILGFDVLVELFLMALDLVFETIHILIEIIDELLESLLAGTLATTKHENEVIIVNVALLIVVFGLYKIFHGVRFIFRLKKHIKTDWLNYKQRKILDWNMLPLLSKLKLVAAYLTGFSLIFLLAF